MKHTILLSLAFIAVFSVAGVAHASDHPIVVEKYDWDKNEYVVEKTFDRDVYEQKYEEARLLQEIGTELEPGETITDRYGIEHHCAWFISQGCVSPVGTPLNETWKRRFAHDVMEDGYAQSFLEMFPEYSGWFQNVRDYPLQPEERLQ